MTKKAKKTFFTVLQLAIFIGLGIFLVWYMYHSMAPDAKVQMIRAIKSARLIYLVPVLFVGFFSHYFRALRWRLLLEPLDIKPTRLNTWCAVMIGYLVNAILPRFGEVAKCTVLARYEKVPADKMVGTIVAERAFDLVCLVIVFIVAFALEAPVIGDYARRLLGGGHGHTALYILGSIVAIVLLIMVFYQRIKRTKVGHAIKGIGEGVRSIGHLRHRALFIVYTFAIWGCYVGMIILGFLAMPSMEHLPLLSTALVVLSFGAVSMIFTPGGMGAYPYVIGAVLLQFHSRYNLGGTLNEATGNANAYGSLSWAAQTGVIVVLGLIALVLLPIYNRTPHNAQTAVDTEPDL